MYTQSIAQLAQKYISHPTIQTFATLPPFPVLRVEWLRAFIFHATSDRRVSELYPLVASLLQHGLDTHDDVPIRNQVSNLKQFRRLQLHVLAGDYFSSRFYQLLSQSGDIAMIRTFSAAVCEVNQAKIELYQLSQRMTLTAREYMDRIKRIKRPVFDCLKRFVPAAVQPLMDVMLDQFTTFEIVGQELNHLNQPHRFAYWYVAEHGTEEERERIRRDTADSNGLLSISEKYQIPQQLSEMLRACVETIEDYLRDESDHHLLIAWQQISGPLVKPAPAPNAVH